MWCPLRDFLVRHGATLAPAGDCEVAAHFGDLGAELRAATGGLLLIDRSRWSRIHFGGKDAIDLFNRLTTNYVAKLAPGEGNLSCTVTPKGRVVSAGPLYRVDDGLLYVTHPGQDESYPRWIDTYVFREEIVPTVRTRETVMLSLFGPKALDTIALEFGCDLRQRPLYSWARFDEGAEHVFVARVPGFRGHDGVDLITGIERGLAFAEEMVSNEGISVTLGGEQAHEILRIEAGYPALGAEITEDANPHEIDLNGCIAWDKGCYTGQEVIARLDTYDKVQRHLVKVQSAQPLSAGDRLEHAGAAVGAVTSAAATPGGPFAALAFMKTTAIRERAAVDAVTHAGPVRVEWQPVNPKLLETKP